MKKLLLTTIVLGLSVAASAETADEAAVRAAHEAFVKAAKAGDGAALNKLLADGVQYSHSNTKLENKQEAVAALVKSKGNFEVHSQTIHVYGKAATVGNGTMVALAARDRETAARVHAKALELGGSDEGAPGPRGDGFYGGYFRDIDGNKLVACVFG